MNGRLIAVAIVLAFAMHAVCCAGTTGVLHGYVRDERGQPVEDALVKVASISGSAETHTDRHGYFVFLSLPPDIYNVDAGKSGTYAVAFGARVNSDQSTMLTFRFSSYRHCPALTEVTIAADQRTEDFSSLDVRRAQTSHGAMLVSLPMPLGGHVFSCL